MSGSNDLLAQTLLMQARQPRRPSAQALLAQQMMQQANQQGPTWGAAAGAARVVPGVVAAFLAQQAEAGDQMREDKDLERNREYVEQQRARDMADIRALQPGGMPGAAPAMAGPAPPPPQAEPGPAVPYAAQQPPPVPTEDGGALPASQARYASVAGRAPLGASYPNQPENRGPMIPDPDRPGQMMPNPWHELRGQLPPSNGRMASFGPGAAPAAPPPGAQPPAPQQAGPTSAYIAQIQALAAGGNQAATRLLPGLQWQYTQARADRPEYRPISPGQSILNPQTGQFTPGAPEEVTWGNAVDEVRDGRPVRVQYSNRGGERIVGGAAPYQAPSVSFVDAGTRRIPTSNQTGLPVAPAIPVDVRGQEAAQQQGGVEGRQAAAAPAALDVADRTLRQIDGALDHSALRAATGALSWTSALPGTPMRDFGQRVDQLRGATFLDAIERLRGSGAISDVEGRQATAASARLDRAVSAADFRQALSELRGLVDAGRRRAEARIPQPPGSAANPAAPPGRLRYNAQTGDFE
jgi:hypothetical protein